MLNYVNASAKHSFMSLETQQPHLINSLVQDYIEHRSSVYEFVELEAATCSSLIKALYQMWYNTLVTLAPSSSSRSWNASSSVSFSEI